MPKNDVRETPRCDVEHAQEDEEVEQRRAEVALDDHDRQRDAPHREHRQQVGQRRQPQRPRSVSPLGQQPSVLGQVAGQEDDEDDLEQLRRLAGDGADAQRQARAAGDVAEDEHEQQQEDADRRPGVLVAAQPAVAADQHSGRGEQPKAE